MRKLASFVAILVLICLLIPSLTFAVWWNPLSWFETKNNAEISTEISSSTPSASVEIKTESNWWNPFSWVKKEKTPKQEIISQENLASTTEEIISENDGLDSETPADLEMETAKVKAVEMETAKAKAEAEKYKLQAEQARLEMERLKQENAVQTQTQAEEKNIVENNNLAINKNYKDLIIQSVKIQINAYQSIVDWINSDMIPSLNQREIMLNDLISNTKVLRNNAADPSIANVCDVFIYAYQEDIDKVVYFYRDEIFNFVKNEITLNQLQELKSKLSNLITKDFISETEYNKEIQSLNIYQNEWEALYNDGIKLAVNTYMETTGTKDVMYQKYWSELSAIISSAYNSQVLSNNLNQLYSQQVKPLNCTFSSIYDGFGTRGNINCY